MDWFRIPRIGKGPKGRKIFDGKNIPIDSVSSPGDLWIDKKTNELKQLDSSRKWRSPVSTIRGLEEEVGGILYDKGVHAYQTLVLAANVVEADTVTIGDDTYEVEIVNTDTTKNVANKDEAVIDDNTNPAFIEMEDNEHGLKAGDLIRIDNEIMLVLGVADKFVTASRGHSGTTIAAHVKNSDVYKGGGYGEGNIPVGLVTTLTPAAASAALASVINAYSTEPVTAEVFESGSNYLLSVTHNNAGPRDLEVDGTFNGATNIWLGATLVGGTEPSKQVSTIKHIVGTDEGTAGEIYIPIGFAPESIIVQVQDTDGAIKHADIVVSYSEDPSIITVTNDTGDSVINFEATDVITIVAYA